MLPEDRTAWTDHAGMYELGSLPIGSYVLRARKQEYVGVESAALTVIAGALVAVPDLLLLKAPTIAGRVVDRNGVGLEGITIHGSPEHGGGAVTTHSGVDGEFEMYLPEMRRFRFILKDESSEYDSSPTVYYDPGQQDIELVFARSEQLLLVVDRATGMPIERFGVRPAWGRLDFMTNPPPNVAYHPEGRAAAFLPESSVGLIVWAPGYRPWYGELASREVGTWRIELARGAEIHGRIAPALEDLTQFNVQLRRVTIDSRSDGECAAVGQILEHNRIAVAVDGSFSARGLLAGNYVVDVMPREGIGITLDPLMLLEGESVDLGVVVPKALGRIAGSIVVPSSLRADGLEVNMNDRLMGRRTTTNRFGEFDFDDVAPGCHTISVVPVPGHLWIPPAHTAEVVPGARTDVHLDLRDFAAAWVIFEVVLGKEVGAHVEVSVRCTSSGKRVNLGFTNDHGVVQGSVPAFGDAAVDLRIGSGVLRDVYRLKLLPGERVMGHAFVPTSSLRVTLPDQLTLPSLCRLQLTLSSGERVIAVHGVMRDGVLEENRYVRRGVARQVIFRGLPVGNYTCLLQLQELGSGSDPSLIIGPTAEVISASQMVELVDGGISDLGF